MTGYGRLKLTITYRQLLVTIIIVLLAIFAGGNDMNPDIRNYQRSYEIANYTTEGAWIYSILKSVFVHFGISFNLFRLSLYILGFVTLSVANKKMTGGSPLFFLYYAVSLMMMDSTQTYNFIGMCFLVLGTTYLIKAKRFNRVLYIICLLIASGFHAIFYFYIPFVFVYSITDTKRLTKVYIWVMIFILGLSMFIGLSGLASVMTKVLSYVGLDSYQGYLVSRTRYGHFYPMATHSICCLLSYHFYKKTLKKPDNDALRICLLFNLYGVFAFPFFRFQLSLSRLTRNMTPMTFLSGLEYTRQLDNNKQKNLKLLLLLLSCVLGYYTIYSSYMQQIVIPFFQNNWIWGVHQ